MVRFLADECCDVLIGNALRDEGYDVVGIADIASGIPDEEVIALALRENRVLLTEDKDFGQLVYAHGCQALGVIFLRYHFSDRQEIAGRVVQLVRRLGDHLIGAFVTVQKDRIRIGRLP